MELELVSDKVYKKRDGSFLMVCFSYLHRQITNRHTHICTHANTKLYTEHLYPKQIVDKEYYKSCNINGIVHMSDVVAVPKKLGRPPNVAGVVSKAVTVVTVAKKRGRPPKAGKPSKGKPSKGKAGNGKEEASGGEGGGYIDYGSSNDEGIGPAYCFNPPPAYHNPENKNEGCKSSSMGGKSSSGGGKSSSSSSNPLRPLRSSTVMVGTSPRAVGAKSPSPR